MAIEKQRTDQGRQPFALGSAASRAMGNVFTGWRYPDPTDLQVLPASQWDSLLSHLHLTLSCQTCLTRSSHFNFCLLLSPCLKHWVSPSLIKCFLVLPKDLVLSAHLTLYNSTPPLYWPAAFFFPNQAVLKCDGAHGYPPHVCTTFPLALSIQSPHTTVLPTTVRPLVPAFVLCSQYKQERRLSLNRDVIQSRILVQSAIGRGLWPGPQLQLVCYWKRCGAPATVVKYLLAWVWIEGLSLPNSMPLSELLTPPTPSSRLCLGSLWGGCSETSRPGREACSVTRSCFSYLSEQIT